MSDWAKTGTYEIKTHTGKIYSIEITDRDGVLGYYSEITKNFIPVSKFVGVEVLRRYSDDEKPKCNKKP